MTKSSINQLYYSIGLMSGTSMDKIDGFLRNKRQRLF